MVKWPKSNPDFYKINSQENLVEISNRFSLTEDFYEYALNFKSSARAIANYIFESSSIKRLDVYFFR